MPQAQRKGEMECNTLHRENAVELSHKFKQTLFSMKKFALHCTVKEGEVLHLKLNVAHHAKILVIFDHSFRKSIIFSN